VADNSKIEWTEATWNPITGCSVVSAGCRHCYAMKLAGTRLQHHPSRAGLTVESAAGPVWNGQVRFNEEWLRQPLQWRRPRKIFVCAHGDLFHESVPDEWIDRVFGVMAVAKHHTFQVLTKRAGRMRDYVAGLGNAFPRLERGARLVGYTLNFEGLPMVRFPLPNVWLGVSVEDQAAADARIPLLLQTPAAVRWISAEPLLGAVDLPGLFFYGVERNGGVVPLREKGHPQLDWVVVGGESGTNARPMHRAWARSLRDQCAAAGVPFLFKQWGEWAPAANPNRIDFERVGKRAAGRLLDGVQHDGYPEARP
jgi:protein gp37